MSRVAPDLATVIATEVCNRMRGTELDYLESVLERLHGAVQEAVLAAMQPEIDDARRRARALAVMPNGEALASLEILTAVVFEDVTGYRVVDGALIAEGGNGTGNPRAIFAKGAWQTALRPGPASWALYIADQPLEASNG